jgi:hypothetical protein
MTSADDVCAAIGRTFGTAVRRIPDGETGDRLGWLDSQEPFLARNPWLEAIASEGDWRNATALDKWKHKHGFGCARSHGRATSCSATSVTVTQHRSGTPIETLLDTTLRRRSRSVQRSNRAHPGRSGLGHCCPEADVR